MPFRIFRSVHDVWSNALRIFSPPSVPYTWIGHLQRRWRVLTLGVRTVLEVTPDEPERHFAQEASTKGIEHAKEPL